MINDSCFHLLKYKQNTMLGDEKKNYDSRPHRIHSKANMAKGLTYSEDERQMDQAVHRTATQEREKDPEEERQKIRK